MLGNYDGGDEMTYSLVGEDNYATYGPTISGMKLLRETVLAYEKDFPALTQFVCHGVSTTKKHLLIIECEKLSKSESTPAPVKATLRHLRKAALKSGAFLALTQ
jgi:hypothetical protein